MPVPDKKGELKEMNALVGDIGDKISNNDNYYVYLETVSEKTFYVWKDAWQEELLENAEDYLSCGVVEIVYVMPHPGYRVMRYVLPAEKDVRRNWFDRHNVSPVAQARAESQDT